MQGLELFFESTIKDIDLLDDDRAWVCRGIKHLNLPFIITEQELTTVKAMSMIPTRLSELTLLQTLPRLNPRFENEKVIPWTIEAGLDKLGTLKQLREIEKKILLCGDKEIHWILEHWSRLDRPSSTAFEDRLLDRAK